MADILISNEQTKFSPRHVTTELKTVNNSSNDLSESFEKEVSVKMSQLIKIILLN